MSRRNRPPKRVVEPDSRYNSVLVSRLVNKVMKDGKKSVATGIVYDALAIAEDRAKKPALEILEEAMRNISPVIEVKPRRVGGSTYQVPVEVPPYRQTALAIRWLLMAVRGRSGKSMAEKMAGELVDAATGTGGAIKRKEDTHRMAEANRAFSHYRW
ncbi:MAG: 30S ribosomal protein S7 [Chloroflexi bacterium]|nr:30S ribosomal protein S7 [Chloroflexota bacterium]